MPESSPSGDPSGSPRPSGAATHSRVSGEIVHEQTVRAPIPVAPTTETTVRAPFPSPPAQEQTVRAFVPSAIPGAAQGSEQATRLAALEAQLVTSPVRYSTPMLRDQINYLYGLISGADQTVGRDALERYAELRKELDAHAAALRQITGGVAQE